MEGQTSQELLKEDTLRDFYAIYPEKFNNKTNGIIQRRWLQIADEPLSNEIDRLIGKGWRTNIHELRKLLDYKKWSVCFERIL